MLGRDASYVYTLRTAGARTKYWTSSDEELGRSGVIREVREATPFGMNSEVFCHGEGDGERQGLEEGRDMGDDHNRGEEVKGRRRKQKAYDNGVARGMGEAADGRCMHMWQ